MGEFKEMVDRLNIYNYNWGTNIKDQWFWLCLAK